MIYVRNNDQDSTHLKRITTFIYVEEFCICPLKQNKQLEIETGINSLETARSLQSIPLSSAANLNLSISSLLDSRAFAFGWDEAEEDNEGAGRF